MSSILITGGGGYFGRALVHRLLIDNQYDRICIYSRDEAKHAAMRDEFGKNERLRYFVGCVRDRHRLDRAMRGIDVVVHAAALKRIEVGAYNPDEMVKTNVIGTMYAVDAAAHAGVKKFVMLSTDKAFQPISPYGQSKALAESLVLSANNIYGQHGTKYSVMRYGNVAGSTGSIIPKLINLKKNNQIAKITDPDCTRFWMTSAEAVNLVMDTMTSATGAEIVIPDLPAYRLGDLVEAIGIRYEVVGLPKWEKKHENMNMDKCSETARRMSVDELREGLEGFYG